MKIYAFDVDDTLEVFGGPISILSIGNLKPEGHIVGLNVNGSVLVQTVPLWHRIFSFIGPMEMSKDAFLNQLKAYIQADNYIMVGNIKGISGGSDDQGAANLAGWCSSKRATSQPERVSAGNYRTRVGVCGTCEQTRGKRCMIGFCRF